MTRRGLGGAAAGGCALGHCPAVARTAQPPEPSCRASADRPGPDRDRRRGRARLGRTSTESGNPVRHEGIHTMTTDRKPRLKITYATLRADNEELHAPLRGRAGGGEGAARRAARQPHRRQGAGRRRDLRAPLADRSRHRSSAPSRRARRQDVRDAVEAARRAQPAWAALGWEGRLEILRRAAELISERQMTYAGLMAIEVGKNRLEALGEVEEAADLIRYYAQTARGQRLLRPPDGQPRRRDRPHPDDPAAARRVRGHQPVQLPDGAVGRPVVGGPDGRQHRRLQAGQRRRDERRARSPRPTATRASRPASSTS